MSVIKLWTPRGADGVYLDPMAKHPQARHEYRHAGGRSTRRKRDTRAVLRWSILIGVRITAAAAAYLGRSAVGLLRRTPAKTKVLATAGQQANYAQVKAHLSAVIGTTPRSPLRRRRTRRSSSRRDFHAR